MRSISKEFKKYTIHAVRIAKVDGKIVNQPLKAVETYETVTEKTLSTLLKMQWVLTEKKLFLLKTLWKMLKSTQ